jgi:FAD/FMN-containing dehydrogenase
MILVIFTSKNMAVDVSELRSLIAGTVLIPGDEGFEESLRRFASNTEKRAAVVALVTSSADVAAALSFAKKTELEVAVSGGRHSASGASSTEGGLVSMSPSCTF